jgi:hypothetical protein
MDIPFGFVRWCFIASAFGLVVTWFLLPTNLQLHKARESTPVARRIEMKGIAYLVLSGAAHAEIRIRCTNAPGLFWGLGALLSSALVVMSLYFAPSNPGPALARGSLKG